MDNPTPKMLLHRSSATDAVVMVRKAGEEHIDTVWDRLEEQQPQCGFCLSGLSCHNCGMGPCRINPFGEKPQKGVCGANADVLVARNLGRAIAAGASAHSDHGREILEAFRATAQGLTSGYHITDVAKLRRLAAEYSIPIDGRSPSDIALDLSQALGDDFGTFQERVSFVRRAPEKRRAVWEGLGITPRGIDRENVEMLHRTHMGVDSDYVNILLHGLRTGLSDGWGGSMLATELSDVLFGTPSPVLSQANLGTLKPDCVNVALHGHNPLLSDAILTAASDAELVAMAISEGAKGINLVGMCCTGTESLMRRGLAIAGNHLMQELAVMTGALEAVVVDYQCVMPGLVDVARCFHTQIITTSNKAKHPGAIHIPFDITRGLEAGRDIVRRAVAAYPHRNRTRVRIPVEPVPMMAGFSVEAILRALGGTLEPLVAAIAAGSIRGVVGVVGCNNPKIAQDSALVALTRRLIQHDVLVLSTGCAAIANGKAGQMTPAAARMAGPGLAAVCGALGLPPVLHMGSCVDNTRILMLATALANHLGVDICQLPVAGAAPEWYSEKALAIGAYVVASGIYTVLGVPPAVSGSKKVVRLLTDELEAAVGARFAVEPDPERAATLLRWHIESKRKALGLSHAELTSISMPT